jgi:hypothetical protein
MVNNPLIQRYRYSTLRPKQFWIYVTIYISIVLLIVFINYSGYKYQTVFKSITEFNKSLYYQFLTFQVIILFIWSAYNSGSAIREEILNKSFDFFRMLPLPAHEKALGILIGKNLVVLLFAAINLVLLIFFGLAGEININLQGQIILVLISITILANSASLLLSINPAKKRKGSGIVLILFAIFFLVPWVISAVVMLSSVDEMEHYPVYFFKLEIPILLLISLVALYLSCWMFKGILRRFNHEQEPLFTRKGALLFLFGYIIIAAGLYYTYMAQEPSDFIYSFWLVTLLPVLLIPLASLRGLDNYIEYSRNFQGRPTSGKTSIVPMLVYSNLSLSVGLFAIWAVSSIGTSLFAGYADMKPLSTLYDIFILLTCCLFLVLLLELYVVYKPASGKIGLLLGFIAAVYIILPSILSAIFDSDIICLYSPAGFLANLFKEPDLDNSIKTSVWLMNVMFCVLPALFIWKRYNYILTQRQKM